MRREEESEPLSLLTSVKGPRTWVDGRPWVYVKTRRHPLENESCFCRRGNHSTSHVSLHVRFEDGRHGSLWSQNYSLVTPVLGVTRRNKDRDRDPVWTYRDHLETRYFLRDSYGSLPSFLFLLPDFRAGRGATTVDGIECLPFRGPSPP